MQTSKVNPQNTTPAKKNSIHPSLLRAGQVLIEGVETPSNLLNFLRHTIVSLSSLEREVKSDKDEGNIFGVTLFIEHMVEPWMSFAGPKNDLIYHIADKLEKLTSWFGAEGYCEIVSAMTMATGYRMKDGLMFEQYELPQMKCLKTLTLLYYPINEYDEYRLEERKTH